MFLDLRTPIHDPLLTLATLPHWTTIGFTGHREVDNESLARTGIKSALDAIAARRGPLMALASAAPGGDTLFLEQAVAAGIPTRIILPFSREKFLAMFSREQLQRSGPLFNTALHVEELRGAGSRDDSFLDAGVLCVERCDVMVALWNGEPARGKGGTAEIVEHARALAKPLIIVDQQSGALTLERFDRLASLKSDLPQPFQPREAVQRAYDLLDQQATSQRPSFLQIVLLHLAAEAFALIPLVFAWHGIAKILFSAAELSLLGIALILAIRLKHVHHNWVQSRIAAELCRSFLALWHAHRRGGEVPRLPVPGLRDLYQSLSMAWYLDRSSASSFEKARNDYLKFRIEEQISYFEASYQRVAPRFRRLRRLATAGTFVAILAGVVALALSIADVLPLAHPYLELLNLLLPLLSAGLLSLVVSEDYMRRSVRYAEMLKLLRETADKLRVTRTFTALERIALETEEQLLQEVLEWHSLSLFAREPH